MKPYVWKYGMTANDVKDGAYWERNILALLLAKTLRDNGDTSCGWYVHGEWEGWSRVISMKNGSLTFHIPDDFDTGDLPEIEPNWDGHTTKEKWINVMSQCGCGLEEV